MPKKSHGMAHTRFYNIWSDMKTRCNSDKYHATHRYKGRGIEVCERWKNSFENFKNDMYKEYLLHSERFGEKNTTINRTDNEKNYTIQNCRWVTKQKQFNNKSNSYFLYHKGVRLTIAELSQIVGVERKTLTYRIERLGMSVEDAIKQGKLTNNSAANIAKYKTGARKFEYKGKIMTVKELSKLTTVKPATLKSRLYMHNWSVEKSLIP
jgi:hypothetical protein